MQAYVPSKEIWLAAKSGFLTKTIWNDFFGKGGVRWRNFQWNSFLKGGLFRKHPARLAVDVLVLNPKHPVVQKLVGADISAPPFIGQLDHDETVMRSLLVLRRERLIDNFRFEPEQKRLGGVRYKDDGLIGKVKFPDALIDIGGRENRKCLAFELELTSKSPKRYRQMMTSLDALKGVDKIIFITRTRFITEAIKRAMPNHYFSYFEKPIGFGTLEHWTKNPMTAPIVFEDEITSIEKMSLSLRLMAA